MSHFVWSNGISFQVVKLVLTETNLSAYLLAPVNAKYICLDAGTINAGIENRKKILLRFQPPLFYKNT
jgi:hypothetical protein